MTPTSGEWKAGGVAEMVFAVLYELLKVAHEKHRPGMDTHDAYR
jgi:hypothetical protein